MNTNAYGRQVKPLISIPDCRVAGKLKARAWVAINAALIHMDAVAKTAELTDCMEADRIALRRALESL